ncbi:MAG: 2-oxoglutarate dehydrogenase E1 component [Chloroflexi bacterium UTCFX4]|nr:MAG: 2-oxoglutarate dehydrogenase E1 component [Chloroflexi bacterium UTCFX4]
MDFWNEFPGPNAGYVLELYERYRQNPDAVDANTRAYFEKWTPPSLAAPSPQITSEISLTKIAGAVNLAQAIRSYGHLAATLDPLRGHARGDPSLELETHDLTQADLQKLPASLVGGPLAERAANALEAIQALRAIYSASTGYSYEHIHAPAEREWLRDAAESRRFHPTRDAFDPLALLARLTRVEVFEHFLHRSFPGKTRFSIEGLDMLVPMLDEIIAQAARASFRFIFLGMAHRGRLNVLANVLNKPLAQILAEFQDPTTARDLTAREELGWTGDVKYHLGAHHLADGTETVGLCIVMPPNPSHLEAINPVAQGMARATGTHADARGAPQFDPKISLPLLIHGDAAFPGEGIVAETLNLSRLNGYQTGGTIHLIANNQLGYTTTPRDGRSTLYASDLAKGFEIPIVHVNADDPEACLEAARLATAYRAKFGKDFLIDLVGYRRHGHNEGDEPSFTQPLMYEKIAHHPTVRALWANVLIERGLIADDAPTKLIQADTEELANALQALRPEQELVELAPQPPPRGAARQVETAVPLDTLRELNQALVRVPETFALNPKLERPMGRRLQALENPDAPTIDWATAEELAFATILQDGIAIRLTGQDVERGTFGQRHAVFHDVKTGATFTPLQALPQAQAAFEVHDSPLTEAATIGFEYGYNVQEPARLVIWEAQYGDFINQAQVMIDEFIVSARAKWGQTPSLVLLLPHASEGQGPDHSSGRLERFLALAAETNLRIAYPTTAAQYFHLLRRQALLLKTDPLPLIVMTPKSLLRHPSAASRARELAENRWQPVLDDSRTELTPDQVTRLILCSGKIYVDLVTAEQYQKNPFIAIARVEQPYRFPEKELQTVLARYSNLQEVVWLQEEPENMGAWTYMQPRLRELINGRVPLRYIGRPANSSPAEGSTAWFKLNQKQLVARAFDK